MKNTDPTTKALQDIATQLKRIADYMEHAQATPPTPTIVNVREGVGVMNNGTTEVIGHDGRNYDNSTIVTAEGESAATIDGDAKSKTHDAPHGTALHYDIDQDGEGNEYAAQGIADNRTIASGERGVAAQEIKHIDNPTIANNDKSFNTNADTAIKSLTSAIKTHAE